MKSIKSIGKGLALWLLIAAGIGLPESVVAETAVWDGSMVRLSQGTGTIDDPFLINTAEEMAYLLQNYDYNMGIYYRKYFRLTRDLDMKSTQWTFGSATHDRRSFRAHFDGAGHKISNIEISLQDSPREVHYGLFPQLGGDAEFESVIENLEVENIHFVRSTGAENGTYNFRIGGLVGQMYRNSRISNCIVHGFQLTDYATDVTLRPTSRISANPLIGEIQHQFGDTARFHRERGIMLENCFGRGTADLSHFHGQEGQVFTTDIQGKKQLDGFSYNGYVWYDLGEEDCSFSMTPVDVTPAMGGSAYQYEGYFNRQRGHTYTYRWVLDGVRVGTNTSAVVTVEPKPYIQRLGLTLFDNGMEAGSGAILIEPDKYDLNIDVDGPGGRRGTHNVSVKMSTESGLNVGENDFKFSWQDVTDDYKEVATTPFLRDAKDGHTYLCLATHREHPSAKFSIVKSYSKPIYVCNRGISEYEASAYTTNSKTYAPGRDDNDGLTPETAVKTLKRAYQLLKSEAEGGSIGTNVIIIMGSYEDFDCTEFYDNRCTTRNPNYFLRDKPALITGRSGIFRNGRMLMAGLSIKLGADTRYEQINLHGTSFETTEITDQAKIFACGHNLTMGYGISINGYKTIDFSQGMPEGIFVPSLTLYGGQLNNNDPEYVAPENTITILSGTYGRLIAGDGYTLQMDRTGNVSGSPQRPIRTEVVCDAANYFDPYHSQYDIALIIGGQADGTLFADTEIEVRGTSRVGRIVGGNIAFGRSMPGRPADSFFGQTNININGGSTTEIIGTNFGRYGHILYPDETDHDSCVTYFYGRVKMNINSGIVQSTLYGGGAADVVGFSYDKKHHTNDPHVPYWHDGKISFGTYEEAVGQLPVMQLSDGILDLNKTEIHVNINGDARIMGSVYGGSLSSSELLPTRQAGSQSGCIFGDTYVNITGGRIEGYVFGGCQSNLTYFENSDNSGFPTVNGKVVNKMFFTRMAQLYGNTHINITGGEVTGMVFGGGEGPYYRAVSEKDRTNAVDLLGSVYGSTHVTIGGDAIIRGYVFGAGNYAHILRTGDEENPDLAGSTEVNIVGGNLYGAVIGAGHGHKDEHSDDASIFTRVQGDTYVTATGGTFIYSEYDVMQDRYNIGRRIYGYIGGGLATSTVRGNTHLKLFTTPFNEDLKTNAKVNANEDLILCAGGYGKDCSVAGTSFLEIKSPIENRIDKVYGGGIFGNVGNSNVNIFSGKVANVYGGCRTGNVLGETFITVGVEGDSLQLNSDIDIETIFGGNEASGTVGGGDANKGTHVKVNGGAVLNLYGAGDGLQSYNDAEPSATTKPHVNATWISVSGTDSAVAVINTLYGGGNNATVGFFEPAANSRPEYGMVRETLRPNTGSIHINIGSHVRINKLVMGSNGEHLMENIPSYTTDGETWFKGFESQEDFETFCQSADVSCTPVLTFNNDGQFHNNYEIDDRKNLLVEYNTPGEMDATDVVINSFFGGGNRGSMTSDSLYQYTLPTGVLILNEVVGGCEDAIIEYTETEGPNRGVVRRRVGGMKPYNDVESAIHDHRTQLNLFCQFAPLQAGTDSLGRSCHSGAKIYGGCLNGGVSVGTSAVNLHSDLLGGYAERNARTLMANVQNWTSDAGQIYGGGKGENTESIGNTYVSLKGAIFNGQKCVPNVIHAFGGGMSGNVVGRCNIYCDFQCPIAEPMDAVYHSVWGCVYGGGYRGNIVRHSRLIPEMEEPKKNGTHVRVWSGQINEIYGGSRCGNVEGACFIDINDKAENHFHTIIRRVFGGNDVSGTIGRGTIPPMVADGDSVTTSTYVLIREEKKNNGQYTGFPLIAEVFGGGNGEYGEHAPHKTHYESGQVPTFDNEVIDLAGLEFPNVDSTYVEVRGGTIWYLYGGANSSYVTDGSVVKVNYNDENADVRCCFDGKQSKGCYQRGLYMYNALKADGGGIVTDTEVRAEYNILSVFGGNRKAPLITQPEWHLGQAKIHNVYGGSNHGNVYYYKGNSQSDGEPTAHQGLSLELNHPKLDIDNVFGGCRLGNVMASNIYRDETGYIHTLPVRLKDYEYGTSIHIADGTYGRVFGGNDISGTVLSGTRIQIEGGKVHEVYGAGNGGYVYQATNDVESVQAVFDNELRQYVCRVPLANIGKRSANDLQKIKAIEKSRPNIAKSYIEVAGGLDTITGERKTVYISGALYAGGNCATIIDNDGQPGDIRVDIGDYTVINNVYLGSNGQQHIDTTYINNLKKYNGIKSMAETFNGRTLLDYHMDAVTMHGLPRDFQLRRNYNKCYIGSFYMGGARGSIATHGELALTFPQTMLIFNKIVGGSDRARIDYVENGRNISSEGGILWDNIGQKPEIKLDIRCPFQTLNMNMDENYAANDFLCRDSDEEDIEDEVKIYPGCFLTGKIEGIVDINVDIENE